MEIKQREFEYGENFFNMKNTEEEIQSLKITAGRAGVNPIIAKKLIDFINIQLPDLMDKAKVKNGDMPIKTETVLDAINFIHYLRTWISIKIEKEIPTNFEISSGHHGGIHFIWESPMYDFKLTIKVKGNHHLCYTGELGGFKIHQDEIQTFEFDTVASAEKDVLDIFTMLLCPEKATDTVAQ